MRISRRRIPGATLGLLVLGGAACSRATTKPVEPGQSDIPVTTQVLPLRQLYVLELSGVPPTDTAVTFKAGQARTVIVRHAPPDNSVFAELLFPKATFEGLGVDSVHVTVRPRPGIYGLEFECSYPMRPGARLTFKYPVHFQAPVGAQQKYGGPVMFERSLSIARKADSDLFALMASTRPASDNLEAPLPGPGMYLVAAPR